MKSKQMKQKEAVQRNVKSVLKHGKFLKSGKKPSELSNEQIMKKLGVPNPESIILFDESIKKVLAMKNGK